MEFFEVKITYIIRSGKEAGKRFDKDTYRSEVFRNLNDLFYAENLRIEIK
jgi:hypothetical protein